MRQRTEFEHMNVMVRVCFCVLFFFVSLFPFLKVVVECKGEDIINL